jgi:hypothetical protein
MDGGIAALSGFLYQTIFAGGLKAISQLSEGLPAGDTAETLVAFAHDAALVPEAFDQDLGIISNAANQGLVLVQVKYTANAGKQDIYPKELNDILKSFKAAAKRAQKEHKLTTSVFVIVTNRGVATSTDARINKLKAHPKGPWQELHLIKKDFTTWADGLIRFAHQYGARDEEIDCEKLVGRIVTRAVDGLGKEITARDLRECLAGNGNAKPLVRRSVSADFQNQLNNFTVTGPGTHVLREQVRDTNAKWLTRAMVVFYGPGGTGKTASLKDWAARLAVLNDDTKPLIATHGAKTVAGNWIEELVSVWRGNAHAVDPNPEVAISRLIGANPQILPPVLHLSLDGLDEPIPDVSYYKNLETLFQWFGREDKRGLNGEAPRARLVVTCRRPEDLQAIWPGYDYAGYESNSQAYHPIKFGDFSDTEFTELVRTNLSSALQTRLLRGESRMTVSSSSSSTDPFDMRAKPPLDDELVSALKDPTLWRAFYELNEPQKVAALDGDLDTKKLMGQSVVNRFCRKVAARRHWRSDDIASLLTQIARGLAQLGMPPYTERQWQDTGTAAGANLDRIKPLFDEADSGGLIIRPDRKSQWRWRHSYVEGFLKHSDGILQ